MGKKIKAEMDAQRQTFVEGAVAQGVDQAKASEIFELVNKFAGYGFNKSHAAAYALVAYQTAYLKANYPVEFMAATMTYDLGNTDKLNVFRQELQRLGIALLPPDINRSNVTFSVSSGTARERQRCAMRWPPSRMSVRAPWHRAGRPSGRPMAPSKSCRPISPAAWTPGRSTSGR